MMVHRQCFVLGRCRCGLYEAVNELKELRKAVWFAITVACGRRAPSPSGRGSRPFTYVSIRIHILPDSFPSSIERAYSFEKNPVTETDESVSILHALDP